MSSSSAARDICERAFVEVSSARPGHTALSLRDTSENTFWESDAECPHHITIHFPQRTAVTVCSASINNNPPPNQLTMNQSI